MFQGRGSAMNLHLATPVQGSKRKISVGVINAGGGVLSTSPSEREEDHRAPPGTPNKSRGGSANSTAAAQPHEFYMHHSAAKDLDLDRSRAQLVHSGNTTSTSRNRIRHLGEQMSRDEGNSSGSPEDADNYRSINHEQDINVAAAGAAAASAGTGAAPTSAVRWSSFEYTYNHQSYDLRTTLLVVLANFLVSMFMSTSVKILYVSHGFKYPLFVTSMHMLFSFVLSAICVAWFQKDKLPAARERRAAITDQDSNTARSSTSSSAEHQLPLTFGEKAYAYFRTSARVAPFCVLGALSIACGNVALLYLYPSLHQMLQNTTPIWSVLCAVSLMSKRYNLVAYLALIPVCAGGALAAWGEQSAEKTFVWVGVIVSLSSAFLRALKAALQGMLIDGTNEHEKLDPITLLFYSSPLSLVLFLLASSHYEGGRPWVEMTKLPAAGALWLAGSASFAALFNLLAFLLIGRVGPTTMMVVGNLKTPATALLSVLIFHNAVTSWQILAFFIVSAGCFLFTAFGRQVDKVDPQEEELVLTAEEQKIIFETADGDTSASEDERSALGKSIVVKKKYRHPSKITFPVQHGGLNLGEEESPKSTVYGSGASSSASSDAGY
ncbi:unnamed protein product [Amoebophrya sp. A120]|nr:unnamed protein product [Amoebophrya sp. A120]|eukprot:GSA120T00012592001.1